MKKLLLSLILTVSSSALAIPNEWVLNPESASVVRNFTESLSGMPMNYDRYVREYENICQTAYYNASHPNMIKIAYRLAEQVTSNTPTYKSGILTCEIMVIRK